MKKKTQENWLSNEKRGNELRLWNVKKIICKYSLLKECLNSKQIK